MQMTVQRAKVVSTFITPEVGPVRLDGYSVVVESGETFRCATRREARELIAQCDFVEVSGFDAPGATQRYFTTTGDIDWEFISSVAAGLKRDLDLGTGNPPGSLSTGQAGGHSLADQARRD